MPAKRIYLYMLLIFAVLVFFNITQMLFRDVGFNTATHLADAFLNGRMHVFPPGEPLDVIEHEGRYYVPFPPAPAIMLMPLVALFGLEFSPLWITPLMGALTAGMLVLLYFRFTGDEELSFTLSVAMILGTAFWLCVRYAFDTYLAHMLTVLVVTIALWESLGKQRGWLIGICLGIACSSRQLSVFVIPFVFTLLWCLPRNKSSWLARLFPVISASAVLGVFLFGLLWYNWARFGSPLDSGYSRVIEETWYTYRLEKWGNFSWRYIPSNFLRFFVAGFTIEFHPPGYLQPYMSPWGTSLTYASPFIFYGFVKVREGLPRLAAVVGRVCTALIVLALLMHKSAGGGWIINGIRYALDFLPLWSLFVALGMQHYGTGAGLKLRRYVVAYSVLLNVLAIVITHTRHFFPA